MAYEQRRARPALRPVFLRRVAAHAGAAVLLLAVSLAIGMWGYSHFEGLAWRDAFLNAAMLLGGMGPVDAMHTDAGKIFAGSYALACGLLFVLVAGVVLAPVLHRVLHALHVDCDDEK